MNQGTAPTRLRPGRARRNRGSRFWLHDAGVAAVETALLMPVLLMFMFGIVELGRAAYVKAVLIFAVQEGSRYAMVDETADTDQVRTKIESKFDLIDADKIESFTVTEVDNGDETKTLQINLAYRFESMIPMLHVGNFTISADAQMIRE